MKKRCIYCGSEMEEGFVVCCSCGKVNQDSAQEKGNFIIKTKNTKQSNPQNRSIKHNVKDDGSIVWLLIGLFLPLVGIILGMSWSKENPRNARMLLKGFIIFIFLSSIPLSCL